MRLSDISKYISNSKVVRDGEFNYLGLAISTCNAKLLTFIGDEKYLSNLSDSVSCIITTNDLIDKIDKSYGVIVTQNPRVDYFVLHNILADTNNEYCRELKATSVGENCKISNNVSISDINVKIGNNVTIEDFVVIKNNVEIKDNSIIRSGCIIGGEGYEFKRLEKSIMSVIHCGGVIIEENVELQYNTAVDKALYTWDNTIIGEYSKLDNFTHIEHGVKIGKRCLIASRSTIGGRTIIGNDSWIGLGAIVSNGLILGNKSSISLGAVVTKNLLDNSKVSGNFAIEHEKYIEFIKTIR